MLRRITRVLRIGLLGIAAALLIWIPLSYGELGVTADGYALDRIRFGANVNAADWGSTNLIRPNLRPIPGGCYLTIPIWQVAIRSLAWPVTSFIIARRRHKRGFPVEPKDASGSEATEGAL